MLWLVLGDYGSGKTLFLVLNAVSSEREVLGNFYIDLPNYSQIEPLDLKDLGFNKLVLLDEIYTWLESRVSGSFLNLYLTSITSQSRHRTIDVYGTLHLFSSVDIRFRSMVHRIVKCERKPNRNPNRNEWDFKYSIMNTYNGKTKIFMLSYEKAKEYFKIYDTYEIVDYTNYDTLELEILKNGNPKELYKKLITVANEIKLENDNITHDSVKMSLLKMGYGIRYEPLIYSYLKTQLKNSEREMS